MTILGESKEWTNLEKNYLEHDIMISYKEDRIEMHELMDIHALVSLGKYNMASQAIYVFI